MQLEFGDIVVKLKIDGTIAILKVIYVGYSLCTFRVIFSESDLQVIGLDYPLPRKFEELGEGYALYSEFIKQLL